MLCSIKIPSLDILYCYCDQFRSFRPPLWGSAPQEGPSGLLRVLSPCGVNEPKSVQQRRLYSIVRGWRSGSQSHRSTSRSREVWGNFYGGNIMTGKHMHQFWENELVSSQNWGPTAFLPLSSPLQCVEAPKGESVSMLMYHNRGTIKIQGIMEFRASWRSGSAPSWFRLALVVLQFYPPSIFCVSPVTEIER